MINEGRRKRMNYDVLKICKFQCAMTMLSIGYTRIRQGILAIIGIYLFILFPILQIAYPSNSFKLKFLCSFTLGRGPDFVRF